ncbi:MAG: cbb3-type cytochrome c oxidase subunit II, partial [Phycisphaerales bacterium]
MPDAKDNLTKSALLLCSLTVFFLLSFAAYKENFGADWYRFQSEYKRELLARAGSERERQAAERFDVGQKQLYLPELNRIDRCVTCHVAIDNPSMADAPQPLTAHPGQIMQNHPKENFGCTICHSGQGRATKTADAHGHVDHWPEHMVAHEELDRACPKCHTERFLPEVPRYNAAMDLAYDYGCFTCHKLRSRGGDIGPDITNAGELHDAEWHFKHFKDPKSVVETSEMPNENFSDEQAQLLTFLMMCYTGEAIPTALLSNPKQPGGQMELPEPLDPLALEGYVGSEFCVSCHGAMHPETVKTWRDSPMTSTYERIRNEPLKDNCTPCHTTGLNSATGHYSEEGVGCEACHGPGRESVRHVLAGRILEHKELIRIDQDSEPACERCHNPHVPTETHAEFYRKLPPRSAPPGIPEKVSSHPDAGPQVGQGPAPGTDTPETTEPAAGQASDAGEEPAGAPESGMKQPDVLPYAAEPRKPVMAHFGILSAMSVVQPPDKIEGGCVSSECHPTTVFGKFVHGPTAQQDCL